MLSRYYKLLSIPKDMKVKLDREWIIEILFESFFTKILRHEIMPFILKALIFLKTASRNSDLTS